MAGARTFGLLALLGASAALLVDGFGPLPLAAGLLGVALVMTVAYGLRARESEQGGITSLIAALLTYGLGALAVAKPPMIAASTAVVAVLLLGFKPQVHAWIDRLDLNELQATLKLLLISVVVLPVLPDRGYGPEEAINPYQLWWMVVLIAAISYLGYFTMRLAGTGRGLMLTGLFAGLASSTALTVQFARLERQGSAPHALTGGLLLAHATLVPRLVLILALVEPSLLEPLALPFAAVLLALLGPVAFHAWRQQQAAHAEEIPLRNPLQLGLALRFGVLLAVVLVLARLLADRFGEAGVLTLAGFSGLVDLNAIALSLAELHGRDLTTAVAAFGLMLALTTNSLFKTLVCIVLGSWRLGGWVGLPMLLSAGLGFGVSLLHLGPAALPTTAACGLTQPADPERFAPRIDLTERRVSVNRKNRRLFT